MHESSGLLFRLRAFFLRNRMERELDEEMRFHLEQEAGKQRSLGLGAEEAEREALARFGRLSHHKDAARGAWGVWLFDELVFDVRYALRQLWAHKTFSLVAVSTLALGVGGTVALFGAIHGLLLRPLPYESASDLRVFWDEYSWSAAEFDFARENTKAYQGLASFTVDAMTFRQGDRTSMVKVGLLSGEAFDVLGTAPLLGQTLMREQERLGAASAVVLGYDFWQRALGGNRDIVGARLELDGEPATVVGVMPEGFYFPSPEIEVWHPLAVDAADPDYADNHWLVVIGRLREGWTPQQVGADLDRFAALLGEEFDYPEAWDKSKGYFVEPMRQYLLGDVRPALLLLFGAVGLLLLMASANVAALLVARMSDRESELSIRKAMGAGRGRLSRQLVTESFVLGTIASGAGLLLALAGYRTLVERLPLPTGFAHTLSLEWPLVAATLVLTPLISLLVAAAPLRRLGRGGVPSLVLASRGALGPARRRLQQGLVVGEIVIAVVLVTSAVLLARSVLELYRIDPGVDPEGVGVVDLFAASADLDVEQRLAFFDRLVEESAAIPGVQYAAVTNRLPLRDQGVQGPLTVEGRPDLEGTRGPNSKWRYVSPDYFRALGIELLEGRSFDGSDHADAAPVGIIGADLAQQLWPGESALGRRVKLFNSQEWIEIVGVAEGVHHDKVQDGPRSVVYVPLAQVSPWESATLVLRSSTEPKAAISAARTRSRAIDSRVALAGSASMEEILGDQLSEPLRLRFFLGLVSLMALVIGAVGVYGVISYGVSRRTAEYGLRMALGAERGELLGSVLAGTLRLVIVGVLGGLAAAGAGAALLSGFLYGVEARDPWSYLVSAALLLAVGLLAAAAPAYRASRVDPVTSLQGH